MTQKCSPTSKQFYAKRQTSKAEDLSVAGLGCLADEAVVSLFNAFSSSVRKSPAKPFTLQSVDIGRARSIVSTWKPQMYASGLSRSEFDVPYVLSSFFNRYISTSELSGMDSLQAKAAVKFLKTNADGWSIDDYVLEHESMRPLITKMRYHIGRLFQEPFRVTDLYHLTGHGPNSTTTVPRSNAYLDVKNWDMSGTKASLQQLRHYMQWDFHYSFASVPDSSELSDLLFEGKIAPTMLVDCTETSFVPKKFDSLRDMRPEPTSIAYFSQMLASYFTALLLQVGIDLKTQPNCHKNLSRLGSLYSSLNIATLDWSEASNRIWTALIRAVMSEGSAPEYFSFMEQVCTVSTTQVKWRGRFGAEGDFALKSELREFLAAYTDEYDLKITGHGLTYEVIARVKTSMMATMGNPITFPLQTLIFWAFLQSCTDLVQEGMVESGNTDELQYPSSFGDDGICDSRIMPTVEHYADLLNWKLNRDKSYSVGEFRESCGGDYYRGRFCRPFEPKRPPLDDNQSLNANKKLFQAWLYICANNVRSLCEELDGITHPIEHWLLQYHRKAQLGKICVVPPSYPDGSGYRVESCIKGLQDLHALYSEIPESWRGHGFESPNIGFKPDTNGISPFAGYHEPSFSWYERKFCFRALVSKPGEFEPHEGAPEHYLHYALKSRYAGDLSQPSDDYQYMKHLYTGSVFVQDWTPHLDFFSFDMKSQVLMSANGKLKLKECKLYKTEMLVSNWD